MTRAAPATTASHSTTLTGAVSAHTHRHNTQTRNHSRARSIPDCFNALPVTVSMLLMVATGSCNCMCSALCRRHCQSRQVKSVRLHTGTRSRKQSSQQHSLAHLHPTLHRTRKNRYDMRIIAYVDELPVPPLHGDRDERREYLRRGGDAVGSHRIHEFDHHVRAVNARVAARRGVRWCVRRSAERTRTSERYRQECQAASRDVVVAG